MSDLVPVEALPATNPDGETWQAGLDLVRAWLKEVTDNTRLAYADAIGFPYHPTTGEYRDFNTLRNGATWLAWCARNRVQLLEASRDHVVEWTEALRTARNSTPPHELLSDSTRAHTFTAASSFYRWAVETGHTAVNPMTLVKRKNLGVMLAKSPSTTRCLSEDEAGRLRAMADADPVEAVRLRSSALVAFLLDLGVRIEEALSQRVSKMGWQDGFRVVWLDLKGGTPHPMALPPETARRVDRYLASRGVGNQVAVRGDRAGHPLLFATATDKRVGQKEARALLVRLATLADIANPEAVTPHVLRHTHITELQRLGYDDTTIQKHVGHKQVETTQRYGHHVLALADSPALKAAAAFEKAAKRHKREGV